MGDLFGGKEHVRFSEFNLREMPENAGVGAMNFHHDAARDDRFMRTPYFPCDWLCAIHYLTDTTDPGTPCFCVVPKSNRYTSLSEAHEELNVKGQEEREGAAMDIYNGYHELPIRGPPGTCVLYDTALFHTRLDGNGVAGRRTWHQYYARGGWLKTDTKYTRPPSPVLTDWNLFPKRLALHEDPATRRFFSHWNTAQGEWVASGFSDEVRQSMPRGDQ